MKKKVGYRTDLKELVTHSLVGGFANNNLKKKTEEGKRKKKHNRK